MTDRPLADTASVLLGRGGAAFVAIAIMVSTYGWISAAMLYDPRLLYSFAVRGDLPTIFARVHPSFHTPVTATLFCAFTAWVLASSGTYIWILALSSGAGMVYYGGTCASLIRLRKLRPNADALRIPLGPLLSVLGLAISLVLMTGLKRREGLLMFVTALIAAGNWLWVKHSQGESESRVEAAAR